MGPGGDRGPATAAAADDARVYLGWALATANADAVVACSPSGAIQWTHRRGVGVCGVYTYEVAETKVTQVMDLARQNQHPLQCTIEKE